MQLTLKKPIPPFLKENNNNNNTYVASSFERLQKKVKKHTR